MRHVKIRLGKIQWWKVFTKLIGLSILILGFIGAVDGKYPYPPIPAWMIDLHRKMGTELIGIGLTVLIIDTANESRSQSQEKRELILRAGSPDNIIAREAIRAIKEREWLEKSRFFKKGILRKAYLARANLEDAQLQNADLNSTILREADLGRADLSGADLSFADLSLADLRNADLISTNLENALLTDADLRGADLTGATITNQQLEQTDGYKGATLPDGTLNW